MKTVEINYWMGKHKLQTPKTDCKGISIFILWMEDKNSKACHHNTSSSRRVLSNYLLKRKIKGIYEAKIHGIIKDT